MKDITITGLLCLLLALLFIGLKLGHVIDWNWIWVLSPLWILVGVKLLVLGFLVLLMGILAVIALLTAKN